MGVLRAVLAILLVATLGGCSSLRYAAHVARGEAGLLAQRESIERVIADPRTDARTRTRLREAQAARAFASDHLALPRNRSYTQFVALDRPYVSWSVFATPEFSVDPVVHCFPFAGCVAYRGWFERALAERDAAQLAQQGDDVSIEGVAAFSTLGWFADPIVSSMLRGDADSLDGVIFHELAHQMFYLAGDTAFNESYASFVEREGLREWRLSRGEAAPDTQGDERDAQFARLVLDLRERLRALYASTHDVEALRAGKVREFDAFRARYATLRDGEWHGEARYDAWVARPLDNARLVPFGLYDTWVPAFAALFEQAGKDWPRFHALVRELGGSPEAERARRLAALSEQKASH